MTTVQIGTILTGSITQVGEILVAVLPSVMTLTIAVAGLFFGWRMIKRVIGA